MGRSSRMDLRLNKALFGSFFWEKSLIFIEHSDRVWYNTNSHRNGRLAENRLS